MKKLTAYFILVFIGLFFYSHPLFAQEEETLGDYVYGMSTKLGRGVENIVTSPAEIPCQMKDEMHDTGAFKGFFTGFGKGTYSLLKRVLIGVTEVGTFIIPMGRTVSRVCSEEPIGAVG